MDCQKNTYPKADRSWRTYGSREIHISKPSCSLKLWLEGAGVSMSHNKHKACRFNCVWFASTRFFYLHWHPEPRTRVLLSIIIYYLRCFSTPFDPQLTHHIFVVRLWTNCISSYCLWIILDLVSILYGAFDSNSKHFLSILFLLKYIHYCFIRLRSWFHVIDPPADRISEVRRRSRRQRRAAAAALAGAGERSALPRNDYTTCTWTRRSDGGPDVRSRFGRRMRFSWCALDLRYVMRRWWAASALPNKSFGGWLLIGHARSGSQFSI